MRGHRDYFRPVARVPAPAQASGNGPFYEAEARRPRPVQGYVFNLTAVCSPCSRLRTPPDVPSRPAVGVDP
jgi:hypothetical protein